MTLSRPARIISACFEGSIESVIIGPSGLPGSSRSIDRYLPPRSGTCMYITLSTMIISIGSSPISSDRIVIRIAGVFAV